MFKMSSLIRLLIHNQRLNEVRTDLSNEPALQFKSRSLNNKNQGQANYMMNFKNKAAGPGFLK